MATEYIPIDLMSKKQEIYFSCDVEADGPIPVKHSMLSFGAAAFLDEGTTSNILGLYEAALELLPGAIPDPETMDWWGQSKNQGAWEKARENPRPAAEVLPEFVRWVESVCKDEYLPVFVAYPAGFDFTYMYQYMMTFASSPFSFSALDMKSYAAGLLGLPYREVKKQKFPRRWLSDTNKHEHVALADALEQGHIFMKMKREAEERARIFAKLDPKTRD